MQSAQVHYGVAQAHCSMALFMDVYSDLSDRGIQKMAAWKGWRAAPTLQEEGEEDDNESAGEEAQHEEDLEAELEEVPEAESSKGSGKTSVPPMEKSVTGKDRRIVSTSDDVTSSDH